MPEGIKSLLTEFVGTGEVKGFHFRQLFRGQHTCLYEVRTKWSIQYEVSQIRIFLTPMTKEPYEAYPKANSFGVWAWTYSDYKKAVEKFNEIENHG